MRAAPLYPSFSSLDKKRLQVVISVSRQHTLSGAAVVAQVNVYYISFHGVVYDRRVKACSYALLDIKGKLYPSFVKRLIRVYFPALTRGSG